MTGSCENPDAISLPELSAILDSRLYFVKLKNRITQKLDLEFLSKEVSLKGIYVKKMLERIKNAETDEQKRLVDALNLGLKAFESEVAFDEA